jgi:uncharacterized membrane protein
MAENPYAAPKSRVADVTEALPDGDFIPEGRGVAAGRGWSWIADAWAFTGEQRWTFVGLFLLYLLLQIAANFVPLIGPIAMGILGPVILGGILLGCDAVRRGERLEVAHLFAGFQRHTGRLVALGAISLLFGVLVVVVMLIFVGTSALPMIVGADPSPEEALGMVGPLLLAGLVVMALSIPFTMAMLFATPLIVFAESHVGAALKTSFAACLKNILPFLVWGLAVLVLGIVASIPLFLGWLLLGPVLIVSIYMAYRDIFYAA